MGSILNTVDKDILIMICLNTMIIYLLDDQEPINKYLTVIITQILSISMFNLMSMKNHII